MAAYAALVSLMNDLDDIQNHPRHSFSFDNKQITSLSKIVNFLIDFLESNDSHGCRKEALEKQITSAARAAHDVIESHVVVQIYSGSTLGEKLPRTYFLLDLQKAIDNMDFVWRKATSMQCKEKKGLLEAYSAAASTSGKNVMVGFDAVRDQLMHMMTGKPSGHRQVIPLVGMGGIGKTTLAKNVYQHLHIQHHFDVRLWATISQQYSAETILKQLSTTDSELGEELHKLLFGRRYLIVLDDMWSVEAWNEIQMFMPDNGNGSCVIVTTRLSNLAAHLSSPPFEMNFLDEDKSWELFCGEAFGQEECPLELEKIGKKIVERCQGLPLSISVIGGYLRKSSRAMEYWEKVASLMNPISSSVDDEQCLKIISLSYHHLPAYLKPCFLYMAIYGEDAWIDDVFELFQVWIAEGFLKPRHSLSLEEVAEEYLKDLIERNLILVRERKLNGKVESCGIHDTVRELCLKLGKKEKFMSVVEAIGKKHGIVMRRPEWKYDKSVGDLEIEPSMRSRVGFIDCDSGPWIDFRFMRCQAAVHFQLLNLRHFQFNLHHPEIGSFVFLSSISLFWNVKTITIINYCDISVSYEIWEMPQLRHLEFWGICLPDPLPNQEECIILQNLHTVLGVEDFKLTEEVCKRMPNIKSLSAIYRHFPGDFEAACSYYCPHNLSRFNKLESLRCRFYGDDSKWRDFVLSFTFPTSLLNLSLIDSQLHWEDLAMMIKSLPRLEDLKLEAVKGSEWNLVEEFPHLKKLEIFRCDDWIYWNANSSHFPVLEKLHIVGASELSEIPFDIGEIPTLECITLSLGSVSAAISAMRIVVEQESFGNQDLQLRVFFFGQEEKAERFQKMLEEEGLRSNSLYLSQASFGFSRNIN